MDNPDFFLASSEGYGLEEPRNCRRIKRMKSDFRDDLLLIKIDPPLIGQPFGMGNRDIDKLLVATRHKGDSLFPINHWPIHVHVARLLIQDPELKYNLADTDFSSIAWAELYPTKDSAYRKML